MIKVVCGGAVKEARAVFSAVMNGRTSIGPTSSAGGSNTHITTFAPTSSSGQWRVSKLLRIQNTIEHRNSPPSRQHKAEGGPVRARTSGSFASQFSRAPASSPILFLFGRQYLRLQCSKQIFAVPSQVAEQCSNRNLPWATRTPCSPHRKSCRILPNLARKRERPLVSIWLDLFVVQCRGWRDSPQCERDSNQDYPTTTS
jgi:hypothetical protein